MTSTPQEPSTIQPTSRDETGHVVPLSAIDANDLASAGGKGANLGEVVSAGFRVPDGFVVTTGAYSKALADGVEARVNAHLAASDDGDGFDAEAVGSAIRAEFADLVVPDDVRTAITDAYTALGEPPVAVRSSATAEDLPGASFAGQQDTYLNVRGIDALMRAVRDCWASLWTDRAIAYRHSRGVDSESVRIAVVVQAMVDAELAGVLFTANTVTGARDELVVEASGGLGEAVVSGMVTPDHYRLSPDGTVLESRLGRREVVIRSAPGGGTTEEVGRDEDTDRLSDASLRELARLGTALANHFSRPQDIEWAYGDGKIWLLQARPLTAVPPAPIKLSPIQRFMGPVIAELFPLRPYPMDISAWTVPGVGQLVNRMILGIPAARFDFAEVVPEVDGVVDRFVPPDPRPTFATVLTPLRLASKVRHYDPAEWRNDPRYQRFDRDVAALAKRDISTLDWDTLCRRPRESLELLDRMALTRVDYLPATGYALIRLRLALARLGVRDQLSQLMAGAPTRTQDANDALQLLADEVRADPALRRLFAEETAEAIVAQLRAGLHPELRSALERFLGEFGHRESESITLISAPTWSEAWEIPIGAIQALARRDLETEESNPSEDALARLESHPRLRGNPRRRARLRRRVEAARIGAAFREDTHFEFSRTLPLVRRAVVEIGRRLAAAGVLRHPDDIWHLRLSEVEKLPRPEEVPTDEGERLRSLVRDRQARRAELEGAPLIAATTLFPNRQNTDGALVTGTPGGGGQANGVVRVIRNPTEFGKLRSGEILVCPTTNPAWTPLFRTAAAVVVDTGGPGSHAAIVARECGIPGVMGTGTATNVLVDGQRVTVDGDLGVVRAEPEGR
ncbi:phosphoenolpyruvate synthase [Spiractinospora alimapuensis]|uniref:PEP/pyruvate-binding domain-containing protein n=1 Tax=Spiractinospora alimapuensis TaxID=2820884 RepID=UPI001EEBFC18|nr:PEP/pyruvate-binding domain-containing protein [Spiractinospora alimapuensis]QVQ50284.1 phosphoenolpyruvate synthase [Spiractinospora alimapuensis]